MKSITYIDLKSISINPTNPRKSFPESELNELSESIKQLGVLQPITVRPMESGYEIVCGERRYRACQLAGLETVPAVIRKLTDEEAMDIAITENLQRKDVNPFEEAAAFSYLIGQGKRVEDLMVRFGKSYGYVWGRLKLKQLLPEVTALYDKGELDVSQCLEIAKFPGMVQQAVVKQRLSGGYQDWKGEGAKALGRKIQEYYVKDVSSLDFDKSDCYSCEYNSANTGLFKENQRIQCMNSICLQQKKIRSRVEQLERFHKEGYLIFSYSVYSEEDKAIMAELEMRGIPVDSNVGFRTWKRKPELPDVADFDTPEEYQAEVEEYERIMLEYQQKIADGWRKAIWFTSLDERIYEPSKGAESSAGKQIADLKEKVKRSDELCGDKIYEEMRDLVKKETPAKIGIKPMTPAECDLLIALLIREMEGEFRNKIFQTKSKYYVEAQEAMDLSKSRTKDQEFAIIRYYFLSKLKHSNQEKELFIQWYNSFNPKCTKEIREKWETVYAAKKEKFCEKIKELKGEKDEKN